MARQETAGSPAPVAGEGPGYGHQSGRFHARWCRRAVGQQAQGRRRQPRTGDGNSLHLIGARRFRPDAGRRDSRRRDHDAGLDAALRHGIWRCHRHRRSAQPRLYCRPRVWYPRRVGYRRGNAPHPQRAAGHRRRHGRRGDPGRRIRRRSLHDKTSEKNHGRRISDRAP